MRDTAFYSSAAEVIPVLLIVLAFNYRMFDPSVDESASQSLFLLAVLRLLGVAEVVSLAVLLDDEEPTALDRVVVIAALGFALVGILSRLVRPRLAALARTLPISRRAPAWLLAAAVLVVGILSITIAPDAVLSAITVVAALWPRARQRDTRGARATRASGSRRPGGDRASVRPLSVDGAGADLTTA
jgi:hypothetical protein